MSEAFDKAKAAHEAAPSLARVSAQKRSDAIRACADAIRAAAATILAANAADVDRAHENGLPAPLVDRLLLTQERLDGICESMETVASQADPLGKVVGGRTLDCGVKMEQVVVPLGVVAMVYEARPNVTADAIALCLRSGNACVLRGGSAARLSCEAIADACKKGIESVGIDPELVQIIVSDNHQDAVDLMHAVGLVDVLIPRGSARLIQTCVAESKVPVIETGVGNCHIYIEKTADIEMAKNIAVNAKTQRPGVCNAAESLLVDEDVAQAALPVVCGALAEKGVELVGDETARSICEAAVIPMGAATDEDWGTEYLDLKMSVKCVPDYLAAIAHINRYGTKHSEAIVTSDYAASEAFLADVDASSVYVNASTRFTDGGVFGLGAEIGISTQKLHVRGPMGADVLTSTKYLLRGEGQVR
jgi:glutamate-5-semialdehyde dehydrogenase